MKAMEDAIAIDEMVRKTPAKYLEEHYPLLGVPFSVKGNISLNGMPLSIGVVAWADNKAIEDAVSVQLLRAAGAIPICLTNTPEMCWSYETYNHLYGRTLNPYDLNRTPGGSSGGEAALISAGGSPFGIGTDFGGSIRIPSLFCGIFGHKPTARVVSLDGVYPSTTDEQILSYLVLGPMARYAKDLKPLLKVLTKNNPKLRLDESVLIRKIRVKLL